MEHMGCPRRPNVSIAKAHIWSVSARMSSNIRSTWHNNQGTTRVVTQSAQQAQEHIYLVPTRSLMLRMWTRTLSV